MIYTNYIKNLVNIFELINLNLLGKKLCRKINIEELKKKIDDTYKNYSKKIQEEIMNLYSNSFKLIDNYINKIDLLLTPKKEEI